jgi:phosphonate transport system substrate-binding protein
MLTRILIVFAMLSSAAAQSQKADTLVFATYRYADNDRIKNIEPFAEYFGRVISIPVKVKSYNSVGELIAGMKKGETDIVFINTFGYLLVREQSHDYRISAALRIPEGKRSTYQTAIVSSVDSKLTTIEALQNYPGKFSLLLVNPGSTSGNLIPRLKFAEVGITEPDQFFKSVSYTKNHALTLKQIAEGNGDVGAFGSEEYHKALLSDPGLAKKVNLLWESQPIQLGPVLCKKNLSSEIADQLLQALLTLHDKNPGAFNAVKAGWTEAIPADKFQRVGDQYYDAILNGNPEQSMKIIKAFAQ